LLIVCFLHVIGELHCELVRACMRQHTSADVIIRLSQRQHL
jgi:hypothetical protein